MTVLDLEAGLRPATSTSTATTVRDPMRVLLTGSAGFVGSAFRRYFAERPQVTLVCVDINEPEEMRHPWIYRQQDVRSYFSDIGDRTWQYDMAGGYDLVIHLAAVVGGRATIDGQPMKVATDLAIDADFWQWVLRTQPKTVVYFSSSAAYPVALQTPLFVPGMPGIPNDRRLREDMINLDDIYHPDAVYGLVKLVGEQQARHVAAQLPVTDVVVLRPFSGYGPGQALDYPVPSIVARAAALENPLQLWSNTVRDFIHIDDVVEATMAAVVAGGDRIMNVCSGVGTSFVELATLAADLVGYDPDIQVLPGMPSGVAYRVGDPTRMEQVYRRKVPLLLGMGQLIEQTRATLS